MNETISNQFSPQNFSLRVEQREPLTSSLGEDEWLLVAARNPGSVTVEGEGRHTERRIRGNKVNIYSALSSVVAQILSLCRLLPAIWQRFTFNFLGGNLELIWDQNSISLHMVYPLHTPVVAMYVMFLGSEIYKIMKDLMSVLVWVMARLESWIRTEACNLSVIHVFHTYWGALQSFFNFVNGIQ